MICERCSTQVHFVEKCMNCSKSVCASCVKSAKRHAKTTRYVICKDCWTSLPARKKFKKIN